MLQTDKMDKMDRAKPNAGFSRSALPRQAGAGAHTKRGPSEKEFVGRSTSTNAKRHFSSSTTTAHINTMADRGATRGGFASRGGDRGGDRGRGGRGRGRGRRGPKNEEKEWQPVTKLGRLVKAGKIKSMEEIYLHSLPIKEYQIVDFFLPTLKDEVMKVRQLQRCAERRLFHLHCLRQQQQRLRQSLLSAH